MKNASGQALMELIIMAPFFFLSLGGIILLFSSMQRTHTDQFVQTSLNLSDALIPAEERRDARWLSQYKREADLLIPFLDLSFNPSLASQTLLGKRDGVYFDKKRVKNLNKEESNCPTAHYQVLDKEGGKQLRTCANAQGYERAAFYEEHFNREIYKNSRDIVPLFAPTGSLQRQERKKAASTIDTSVPGIALGALSLPQFSVKYASPKPGGSNGKFVDCLMDPLAPSCGLGNSLLKKFGQLARTSASLEIPACFIEGFVKACKYDPSKFVCVGILVAEMTLQITTDNPSSYCGGINKAVEVNRKAVETEIRARLLEITATEGIKEGELALTFLNF